LARIVRLPDLDGNAGDVGLVRDESPKLKAAPARVVPADRLRNDRPPTDAGQVFQTDPSTHLNRILDDTFADGVVLRRLETLLLTRQPFQDRATTSSRRPCAFRGFLLERAPNSMMAIADALAKIAGPGATVRGVQDIGAAQVAADPVDRRQPCVALNLDLDIEKERGFAASSLHREWRAPDAALTGMASELPSLMIPEGKRDPPSTADERQAGSLAAKAEDPLVVRHGSVAIIVDAAVAFAALRFAATRAMALMARLAESPKRSRMPR
jgi:hypothetical protein